jgi:hypothetical protein
LATTDIFISLLETTFDRLIKNQGLAMPLVRENSQLYEVIKVGTVSGQPLQVGDSNNSLTVDGKAYRSAVQFSRPNDTTAYTAGDVIGTSATAIQTLSGIGPSGGHVLVQSVELLSNRNTVPAGMGPLRAHFYTSSPTAIVDNAPFDLVSGEISSYVGYVDLPTPQDLGSVIYTQADYVGRLIQLVSGQTSLFCEIQTINAFTPASGTAYTFRVKTLEAGL